MGRIGLVPTSSREIISNAGWGILLCFDLVLVQIAYIVYIIVFMFHKVLTWFRPLSNPVSIVIQMNNGFVRWDWRKFNVVISTSFLFSQIRLNILTFCRIYKCFSSFSKYICHVWIRNLSYWLKRQLHFCCWYVKGTMLKIIFTMNTIYISVPNIQF